MTFTKQLLSPCPKCGEPSLRILEVRTTAASVRRRKCCDACQHRVTTHEVTQEAFEQAQANATMLRRVRKVLGSDTVEIPCNSCKFSQGHSCAFDLPEYGSDEAMGCNLAA